VFGLLGLKMYRFMVLVASEEEKKHLSSLVFFIILVKNVPFILFLVLYSHKCTYGRKEAKRR